jgi:hypothetical protein
MAYKPLQIKAGFLHTFTIRNEPDYPQPLHRSNKMETFVIRRREGWKNTNELEATAGVSMRIGNEEMADQVRWIRSYVVNEADGRLGTVCIYQATSADAIREHARRVGMPADEITPVANTVIIRDDPEQPQSQAA